MTARSDRPGAWEELLPLAGRRSCQSSRSPTISSSTEWSEAQPRVRVCSSAGNEQILDFGGEPHDVEPGANPEWDTTSLRVSYQSLTTPATGVRPRRRHG